MLHLHNDNLIFFLSFGNLVRFLLFNNLLISEAIWSMRAQLNKAEANVVVISKTHMSFLSLGR